MKSILLFLLPTIIVSWWDVGHMLTAAIAQLRLNSIDPYAAAKYKEISLAINNLCDNRTRTFIQSAVWSDDIKSKPYSMDLWNAWHFVDTPYVTDVTTPVINYTEATMTSVIATIQARTALKTNLNNLTAERALFARYLTHLVGDIHQPLHSVALFNHTFPKGDAGGNLLKIKILNGTSQNFHSFWDSGAFRIQNDSYNFVRPMNLQNSTQLKRIASSMIDQYGKSVEDLGKIIDPYEWAKQSFLIAQNTTYPFMMTNSDATEEYTSLVYETSRKRITLAGYRLANFVIDIYGANTTKIDTQINLKAIEKMLVDFTLENKGSLQPFEDIAENNLQTQ